MNDDLEDVLKKALARTEAPVDLSSKVMARLEGRRPVSRLPRWISLGAVAATLALVFTGWSEFRQQQARQQEQQLVFALQLASEKIAAVDQRLKKSSAEIRIRQDNFERR